MDFRRLEENICDVVKEEQVKLGYQREAIRLYYPLSSLNHYLNTDFDISGMHRALSEFCEKQKGKLGEIEVSNEKDRFCFFLSPEVSEYVDGHTEHGGFLYDFIERISCHPVMLEEILSVFYRYSNCVHVQEMKNGEFDYLVYFEDGRPDEFRYCLTEEGHGHFIYHRYTKEDYEEFGF